MTKTKPDWKYPIKFWNQVDPFMQDMDSTNNKGEHYFHNWNSMHSICKTFKRSFGKVIAPTKLEFIKMQEIRNNFIGQKDNNKLVFNILAQKSHICYSF